MHVKVVGQACTGQQHGHARSLAEPVMASLTLQSHSVLHRQELTRHRAGMRVPKGLQTGRCHCLHLFLDIVFLVRLFNLKPGVAACDDCWRTTVALVIKSTCHTKLAAHPKRLLLTAMLGCCSNFWIVYCVLVTTATQLLQQLARAQCPMRPRAACQLAVNLAAPPSRAAHAWLLQAVKYNRNLAHLAWALGIDSLQAFKSNHKIMVRVQMILYSLGDTEVSQVKHELYS